MVAESLEAMAVAVTSALEKPHTEHRITRQSLPRASSIGPCVREQVLSVTEWERRPPPDVYLSQRFQRGHDIERIVRGQLIKAGFELYENQRPFTITERVDLTDGTINPEGWTMEICTGHTDGRIEWNGLRPVTEIKSLYPNVWVRVDAFEDFFAMGSFWSKWTNQILLYMYANDVIDGLMIIDDCLGHIKCLPVRLEDHLDRCEAALTVCRQAAVALENESIPDFHHDPLVCKSCWAREAGICKPPMSDGSIKVLSDAQTEDWLLRMDQAVEVAKAYNSIDRKFKDAMKARGDGVYVCGDFQVTVKVKPSPVYEIPDDVKAKFKKMGTRTYTTWERLT